MDTPKKSEERTGSALVRCLRLCYRTFLLHFVLSLSVALVLLCCVLRLDALSTGATARLMSLGLYDRHRDTPSFTALMVQAALYTTAPVTVSDTSVPPAIETTTPSGGITDPDPDAKSPGPTQRPAPSTEADSALDDTPSAVGSPDTLYAFDPTLTEAGQIPLLPVDLSRTHAFTEENGGILFSNSTDYDTPDGAALSCSAYPIEAPQVKTADQPLVLILHTHGTESYAPDGAYAVGEDFHPRSEDTQENVVSVGDRLSEALETAGIPVLHCRAMFDATSYTHAYEEAASYIKETIAAYPSIRYIFDVHRDALTDEEGRILRPVTWIGGEAAAQIMCVVGTDAGGGNHPTWLDNLTVAVHLQARLNASYPGFARPINLRSATFNGQYAPGALLLEIGASGNSVEEARSAAYYLGQQLAPLILGEMP